MESKQLSLPQYQSLTQGEHSSNNPVFLLRKGKQLLPQPSHVTGGSPPGVWSCSQFFEKGSNLTCNYTRAGGGVRLMMFLRQRLCISHWGTHTKEGKNPSLTDVNSISSVKFKEGFKIFFQGITTTPLPFRQSSGHTTAPPQLCLLLSLH